MKIKGQIILSSTKFLLRNRDSIIAQCRDRFLKDKEDVLIKITLESESEAKSWNQLAYLHNELGEKARVGYERWGVSIPTRELAVEKLKMDNGFVDHILDSNDEIIVTFPKRLSSAKKDEVYKFIQDAIVFIQVEMGEEVNTPEEYLKGKRW